MLRHQEPELLGARDPVQLGQDVHRVLLAVRRDDVGVVLGLIILNKNTPVVSEHLFFIVL